MIPVASSARTIARITWESGAMTDAALSGHFEEARSRARQLLIHAGDPRMYAVTEAVSALCICLGSAGTEPKAGFSVRLLEVSDQIALIGIAVPRAKPPG